MWSADRPLSPSPFPEHCSHQGKTQKIRGTWQILKLRSQRGLERNIFTLKLSHKPLIRHLSLRQIRKKIDLYGHLFGGLYLGSLVLLEVSSLSTCEVLSNLHCKVSVGLGLSHLSSVHDDISVSMIRLHFCKQKHIMHCVVEIIIPCQKTVCYSIRLESIPLTLSKYFLHGYGSLCFFSEITLDFV